MAEPKKPRMKDFPQTAAGRKEYVRQYSRWRYHAQKKDPEFLKRMADKARRRREGMKAAFYKSRTTFERERDKTDFDRGYRLDRFMGLTGSRLVRAISDIINGSKLGV